MKLIKFFFGVLFLSFLVTPSLGMAQQNGEKVEDLVLALEKDYPPFLFFENNTPQGIAYDYTKLVAEKMGVELRTTEPLQLADMLEAVKNGKANLLSDITKTPERDAFLEFSKPFVETPAVVISRANEEAKWTPEKKNTQVKIAVGKGYGVVSYLKENYPEAIYLELASDAEVIKAVSLGASDVGVLDAGSLSYLLQKEPLSNISVVEDTGFLYALSFAVPEEKKAWVEVINQTIDTISQEERAAIYNKWLSTIPKHHEDLISKTFWWVILILILLITLAVIWVASLKREVSRQTRNLREVNKSLDRTISEKIEEALKSKTDAEKRSKTLEKTKQAMLNVLEDLQEERIHLAQGKAKDEAVLNNIGDGLVVTDEKGKIILVNPSFENILNFKFKEIKGKKLVGVLKMVDAEGKSIDESERLILKSLSEKRSMTADALSEKYYKKKDGTVFPVAVNVSPIILEGKLLGAVEVFRDITKEKDIDRAKTEFVSLASHQLRTPLTSIKLFLELLSSSKNEEFSETQKDYLEKIKISNDRMIGLVNDLLNVSRLENGRVAINPSSEVLEDVLLESVTQIKKIAQKKGITVNYELPKNKSTKILLDVPLFNEVMTCFLSNAVRYSEAKKGKIIVTGEKSEKEYVISIADNGMGIKKEDQEKLFKKFFRADNAVQKEPDGSGLGLYIADMIMKASGGSITLNSALGKGTTFFLHLPLKGMLAHAGDKSIAQ